MNFSKPPLGNWRLRGIIWSTYFGKSLPQSLLPYLPRFDYILTNVRALSDEQILELKKGLLINALLMLKHIWEPQFVLEHPELIFIHLDPQNRFPACISFQKRRN